MAALILCCCVWASHCRGFSCCGAQALGTCAQHQWHTGLVAPWHVGSSFSQNRDQARVPCIGRWILNHWTTSEVPNSFLNSLSTHHPVSRSSTQPTNSSQTLREGFHQNEAEDITLRRQRLQKTDFRKRSRGDP